MFSVKDDARQRVGARFRRCPLRWRPARVIPLRSMGRMWSSPAMYAGFTVDLHVDGKIEGDLKCANPVQSARRARSRAVSSPKPPSLRVWSTVDRGQDADHPRQRVDHRRRDLRNDHDRKWRQGRWQAVASPRG